MHLRRQVNKGLNGLRGFCATAVGLLVLIALNTPARASDLIFTSPENARTELIEGKHSEFEQMLTHSVRDSKFRENPKALLAATWSRFMLGSIPAIITRPGKIPFIVFYNPFLDEIILCEFARGPSPPSVLIINPVVIDGSAIEKVILGEADLSTDTRAVGAEPGLVTRTLQRLDGLNRLFWKYSYNDIVQMLTNKADEDAIARNLALYASGPGHLSDREQVAVKTILLHKARQSSNIYPPWLRLSGRKGLSDLLSSEKAGLGVVEVNSGRENSNENTIYIAFYSFPGVFIDMRLHESSEIVEVTLQEMDMAATIKRGSREGQGSYDH